MQYDINSIFIYRGEILHFMVSLYILYQLDKFFSIYFVELQNIQKYNKNPGRCNFVEIPTLQKQ